MRSKKRNKKVSVDNYKVSNKVYKVGDVLVSADRIWDRGLQKYIPKGKEIIIDNVDAMILLPSPHLWRKKL